MSSIALGAAVEPSILMATDWAIIETGKKREMTGDSSLIINTVLDSQI